MNKVCKLEIAAVETVGTFVLMDDNSKMMIDQVTRAMEINTNVNSMEQFRMLLVNVVEQLLQKNFPRLIHILYRLDVNEAKLKAELKGNQSNRTAELIADMIIERQMQKQEMRQRFGGNEHISDDEKW